MRKRLFPLSIAGALYWAMSGSAQQLPHHDLLLFSLNQRPDSLWHPFAPRFLTAFNPKGYNNQPSFFSPYELYLTVQLPTDTQQTDIYALDLLLNTLTRVTQTSTAEYSPARMPDGKHFSVVRVESDGGQRLWALPIDRQGQGYPLLPLVQNVGYYCWLRDTLLALFLVSEEDRHALAIAHTQEARLYRIATSIGRCLQKTPDGQLAFVQRVSDQNALLKVYDLNRQVAQTVIPLPSGTEDFALLPDGTYLAADGSRLVQFHPRRHRTWAETADLSTYGVQRASRIAISPEGRLMVVVVQ
jgi:hypothetical protein